MKEKSKTGLPKKELNLLCKYSKMYRVEKPLYNGKRIKIELWRKNKNYGYYNFVCYLNTEEPTEINNAILTDIKRLKSN